MKRCTSVDEYVSTAEHWRNELQLLRAILLETELAETVKWGGPCYTLNGKNVVGLGSFKSYVGLWFYQGALLADPKGVLVNAQEGKTKALRQWRFTAADEIKPTLIKRYLKSAIELARSGQEIKADRAKPVEVPVELQDALKRDAAASKRFDQMSPGCRREYANYVAEAKRAETKQRRIEKILPMIKGGGGLHDKHR